jgi:hypothetical protein
MINAPDFGIFIQKSFSWPLIGKNRIRIIGKIGLRIFDVPTAKQRKNYEPLFPQTTSSHCKLCYY